MHLYKTMGELTKLIDEHFINTEQCKLEYDYDSKYDTLILRIIDGDEVKFNAELDIYNVGYRTSCMGLSPYETNRWFYSQWEQFKRNTFYGPVEQTSIELEDGVIIADPCSNLDGDDDIIELDNVKPGRWLVEARCESDEGRKLLEENPWFTDEHFRKIFHEKIDYRLNLESLVFDELP